MLYYFPMKTDHASMTYYIDYAIALINLTPRIQSPIKKLIIARLTQCF